MALASAAEVGLLSGTGVPDEPWGTMVVAGVEVGEGTVVADVAAGKVAAASWMPAGWAPRAAALVVGVAGPVVALPGVVVDVVGLVGPA